MAVPAAPGGREEPVEGGDNRLNHVGRRYCGKKDRDNASRYVELEQIEPAAVVELARETMSPRFIAWLDFFL